MASPPEIFGRGGDRADGVDARHAHGTQAARNDTAES